MAELYRSALATVLLLPDRYARAGQMTQRIFEAVLEGCLPITPATITGAVVAADLLDVRYVPAGGVYAWLILPFAVGLVTYWVLRSVPAVLGVVGRTARRAGPLAAIAVLAVVLAGLGCACWMLGVRRGEPLPAGFVLLFDGWVCVLVERRVTSSRRWWLRYSTDALAALFLAVAIIVAFNRDLVTARPAAAVLFPVAGWAALRTWRTMGPVTPAAQVTLTVRLADPLAPDPVLDGAVHESPLEAAVDITNETRYLEECSGPCTGCPRPLPPDRKPGIGPEHGGPREPPKPRAPIR